MQGKNPIYCTIVQALSYLFWSLACHFKSLAKSKTASECQNLMSRGILSSLRHLLMCFSFSVIKFIISSSTSLSKFENILRIKRKRQENFYIVFTFKLEYYCVLLIFSKGSLCLDTHWKIIKSANLQKNVQRKHNYK